MRGILFFGLILSGCGQSPTTLLIKKVSVKTDSFSIKNEQLDSIIKRNDSIIKKQNIEIAEMKKRLKGLQK